MLIYIYCCINYFKVNWTSRRIRNLWITVYTTLCAYLFSALLRIDTPNIRTYEASLWYVVECPQPPSKSRFPRVEHLKPVLDPILNHTVRTAASVALTVLVTLVYAEKCMWYRKNCDSYSQKNYYSTLLITPQFPKFPHINKTR